MVKYYKWTLGEPGHHHFERIVIDDIEDYFKHYNTLQVSDMWDSYIHSK